MLLGCSTSGVPSRQAEDVEIPAGDALPRYSAALFYQNTTYILAPGRGYSFSADNQQILATSNQRGSFAPIALALDGAQRSLTASQNNARFSQSYFPDDDRVIVQGDSGGDELYHVYVRATDGTLMDITPGTGHRGFFKGWRNDGKRFYVESNERDQRFGDLYAYEASNYERRMVFRNEGYSLGPISPDGTKIALIRQISATDADIYIASLDAQGAPELITKRPGEIAYKAYTFTPDSQSLVYGTSEFDEFSQAWTHDLESGAQQLLIDADWDVKGVTYSPSGRYRVTEVNVDARTELTLYDTDASRQTVLKDLPDGVVSNIRFNRDESKVALQVSSDTSPVDVYLGDLATGATRRLTSALAPEIDESELVEGRVTRYESFDGLQIPGILYQPREASPDQPTPVLVYVHGGPGGQSTKDYRAHIQHLVNHGYGIFAVNNRGSNGYGKTFFGLDNRRHGEDDLQDVVFAKRYLQRLDWVDPERIGVMGPSYGGFLTLAALAFEPDVFDVGIDIFGVSNWVRSLANTPAWWGSFRDALFDEMGDPATDGERHRRISPLFHADQIRKPLYVAQGANDPRVVQAESDEIVAAVRKNGVPVEYVLFADEGHGFSRRENRVENAERILQFLDKHLRAK